MSYVITQHCCSDALCVSVCPVNCIHPTPDEPGFATADMLYIDAQTCIDCGACADACPVDAIRADTMLEPRDLPFVELNAAFYRENPTPPALPVTPRYVDTPTSPGAIRVAVVGGGAAGLYAVRELLTHPGTEVELFDSVSASGGLVRYGVAPDHIDTKKVIEQFHFPPRKAARFHMHLGVEVGVHISHDELMAFHHAVIYCNGAAAAPLLDVPGAQLRGNYSGLEFAGWYNGHPDQASLQVDLSGERAIVIGNGNVALDVARILCLPPDALAGTDISDRAVDGLAASAIREVHVLGRRGPADAAFTVPELLGLSALPGINVTLDATPQALQSVSDPLRSALESMSGPKDPTYPMVLLRFGAQVDRIEGTSHVESVSVRMRWPDGTDLLEELAASVVVHSIGVRSTPIPGVPFDATTATIPNQDGRVSPDGAVEPGVYVAGWSKRGPVGVIGTNRRCAQETVAKVIEDVASGRLDRAVGDRSELEALVQTRCPDVVDARGWARIDGAERKNGADAGRPRIKFVTRPDLVTAAQPSREGWGRLVGGGRWGSAESSTQAESAEADESLDAS